MNYEYYKIFFVVGKHKNITRAAEELFSSQPAVTRVIKNMETELGCQLFIRGKAGVEFTREGENLYNLIETPFNLLQRMDQDLRQSTGWNAGTIHIGTTDTALQCFLLDFLEAFRRKFADTNFKIYTGSSSRMISRLKNGEIDLVFNTTPFSGAQSLSVIQVHKFNDILVGGKAYKNLLSKNISLKDIQQYPFILLSRGMQYRQFCDDFFAQNGVHIDPVMEADSSGLIVPMVAHNWGLAFVPEDMASEELNSGNIIKIEITDNIPQRFVTLVTDPKRPLSRAVRVMCEMACGGKL